MYLFDWYVKYAVEPATIKISVYAINFANLAHIKLKGNEKIKVIITKNVENAKYERKSLINLNTIGEARSLFLIVGMQ